MPNLSEPLPTFLSEPSRIGTEISVTGKWVPLKQGGRFRKTAESSDMLVEWEDIHAGARGHNGVLSTEINHAIGEDAVLVHHVFSDADALVDYFSTTAADHQAVLSNIATPQTHLVRGIKIPARARRAMESKVIPVAFGEWIYGSVRNDYRRPDPDTAVHVTAKWTCNSSDHLDELKYWWQRVGTDAHEIEQGMLRFEAYQVSGEDALVIHETFVDSDVLKFHLTKGTAARYKNDIDQIAAPEVYYFRGPVAWTIRTYSKFMHLPATYTTLGSHHTKPGGSYSEGRTDDTT